MLLVEPTGLSSAASVAASGDIAEVAAIEGQELLVDDADGAARARDEFTVTAKPAPVRPAAVSAPAAGTPDPGSAKAIALELVTARGWSSAEYDCLVALWNKESGWNVYAHNASSGAYGIPQAVPGNKMASAGADWATSARTQIVWGLGYVQGRYGTPCGAWSHSQIKGWY
ncbi:lytic transglycosylase domain-containing protein [Homoserinibacter sp. GY 40078]|nr:lytic transglycosylase domain-containing protein [Homoserinibacter sp. GY 40078]